MCQFRLAAGMLAAIVVSTLLISPVRGDDADTVHPRFDIPLVDVSSADIPSMQVTISPSGNGPAGAPRGVCPPQVVTYSDVPFTGSSTISFPPGMVEQEIAAATYNVPATDWPIILRTAEVIWGQNHFNSTTTEYTLFVWQGTPATGTVVASFSSDGSLLPHVTLPFQGSQAVSVQVTIDPEDPDQVIVQNDGSNQFSIGFEITAHNNPPTTACTEPCAGLGSLPAICCPPDMNTNAWPAMDSAGPGADANKQWLFARDCPGATGLCSLAVNSGWHQLSDSTTLPPNFINDWAMRAIYEPLNCVIPTGACCKSDGTCEELTENDCNALAAAYQGDTTLCASVNCPQPTGACCFMGGGCVDLSSANCDSASGTFSGIGTQCISTICFPTGVCCMPDGSCLEAVLDTDCANMGGTFFGDGTICANVNCPQPVGACCLSNGFCLDLEEAVCGEIPEAVWQGMGTACDDVGICETGDPCNGVLLGDFDDSGVVNGADVQGFVAALMSGSPSQSETCLGDFDASDSLGVGDVAGMVSALIN